MVGAEGVAKPKGRGMVFACSGAADVGAITDQAARRFALEQGLQMGCISGVAAGIPEIFDRVRNAAEIIVFDGCKYDCVRKVLNAHNIPITTFIRLEDLGMDKGRSPATPVRIQLAAEEAARCRRRSD